MKAHHLSFALILLSLAACGVLGLSACGGGSHEEPTHVELSARAQGDAPLPGFPTHLVTGPTAGRPALFLGPEEDAQAIGYISPGVGVVVKSQPVGDRVRVNIDGPLKVRGWLSLSRLGGYVTHGGRVRGAAASVHPCDFVGVRTLDDDGQQLHVVVAPELGVAGATVGPFEGTLPVTAVSGERPAACPAPEGEMAALPAGQAVSVYDHPDGQVIAQLPASTAPIVVNVARRSGDWSAVRIGTGPYLVGYVRGALKPVTAPAATTPAATPFAAGSVPQRIQEDGTRPLLRVHSGARVKFDTYVIGVLGVDAYAREMQRYPAGEIDVYVAANDDLALRGMVRVADVDTVAAPPPTPGATPPGDAPPPDTTAAPAPPPTPGTLSAPTLAP